MKRQREEEEEEVALREGEESIDEGQEDGIGIGTKNYKKTVTRIYHVANRIASIFFGVDREIPDRKSSPKEERKRLCVRKSGVLPTLGTELLRIANAARDKTAYQDTWSLGYGEMTPGSCDTVFRYLCYEAPKQLRIGEGSSFLDIGSGFGKVVFQARVAVPGLKECKGLECLPLRVQKSKEIALKLEKEGIIGKKQRTGGVEFKQTDAARKNSFSSSHIFCFDYVFNDATHKGVIRALEHSRPKILVLFIPPVKLHWFGGKSYRLLKRFRVCTTGGQHITGYFYAKEEFLDSSFLLQQDLELSKQKPSGDGDNEY